MDKRNNGACVVKSRALTMCDGDCRLRFMLRPLEVSTFERCLSKLGEYPAFKRSIVTCFNSAHSFFQYDHCLIQFAVETSPAQVAPRSANLPPGNAYALGTELLSTTNSYGKSTPLAIATRLPTKLTYLVNCASVLYASPRICWAELYCSRPIEIS